VSIIDTALSANAEYTRGFTLGSLPMPPSRHLAVLACMDARLTIEQILGLKTGEAHVIRNAGGVATEDALRSLIISHHLLGTREIMIINHTDCGMLTFKDEELKTRLTKQTGKKAESPTVFNAFTDVQGNVREQIQTIKSHPWLAGIPVRGFVYDVKSGKLQEVHASEAVAR